MRRYLPAIVISGLAIVGIALVFTLGSPAADPASAPEAEEEETAAHTDSTQSAAAADVTTSVSPAKQLAPAAETPVVAEADSTGAAETPADLDDVFGVIEPVPADANPSVALVVESAKAGTNPERFTTMVMAEAFDREAYIGDPAYREAYLVDVVPSRVYQVAQPAEDVRRLRYMTSSGHEAPQGEWVELIVRGEPGMPVTYNSFDLGEFPNRLTTITVEADAHGVARTKFRGTPGTQARCDILCASPVCSGQLRFAVHITEPLAAVSASQEVE